MFQVPINAQNADLERDVVGLGPPAERVEEQDGFLEALLDQLAAAVAHQQRVAVVHGVAQLQGGNSMALLRPE